MTQHGQEPSAVVTGIIDGDGHFFERDELLYPYFDAQKYPIEGLRRYYLFPDLDGWRRGPAGRPYGDDVQGWHTFMDAAQIAESVLYPTAGLGFAHARDPEWAADLARAYNDFVYDYYLKQTPRLKAVALIPVQAPHAAAQELRRAVTELGMVGAVLPAPGLSRPYGDRAFDPLYETANALGTMLAVHGASRRDLGFDFYHATETRPESAQGGFIVAHPLAQIVQFVNMTLERVFERFPHMKVAFLEAGCGWVPYFIERIDRRTKGLASAQVQQYPVYFHAELEEKEVLTTCIKVLGDDRLVYASDYPHEPEDEIIESLQHFLGREDLSLRSKEKILRDNIKVLYGM